MEHSFDVRIAKEYGIEEAIILNNMYFWIEKNKANNQHFYDGKYWTYNSKKAFAELFPYMSERQIDYAISNLIKKGLIEKGNYNKVGFDRTLWYSITKMGYCILQNCEMEATKLLNGTNKIVEPIPDNKQQIEKTTDIKQDIKEKINTKEKEIFDYWNANNLHHHRALSDEMRQAINKTLKIYTLEEIKTAIQRYGIIFNTKGYYWHYEWTLTNFLMRAKGLPEFLDDGEKWVNYLNQTAKKQDPFAEVYTQIKQEEQGDDFLWK